MNAWMNQWIDEWIDERESERVIGVNDEDSLRKSSAIAILLYEKEEQ